MKALFRAVLHFRLLVLGVAAGLLALGFVQLRGAPLDVLPEFTPPYTEIQTEALGLSAEEVEQLITVPLEADLLNGVEGVEVIRSQSLPSLSSIVLVFESGTDIYKARQLVEERLAQAHALPNVSKPPTLLQPLSSSNRVLMIGMRSDEVSAIEQSVIARWTVRPRLMGVPGVANVSVWGMRDQQLQVQVDPQRLQENDVTLAQVVRSAGNAQIVSPLSFLEASTPGTGGFIESPQQRLQVRHLVEELADPEALGKVPVAGTGGRLRLSDVATITVDHQPLIGDAVVDGGAGLVMVVEKFPGVSTTQVTEDVEAALAAMGPGLAGIDVDTTLFRPASYLDSALGNLWLALAVGAILLLLVVALALRASWRALVVTLVTVPVAVATAALALNLLGQGFNALVFLGLAAGLLVVVDEVVVLVERIQHRLRQPSDRRDAGRTAIARAFNETRTPLTYATLVALLAAVPVAVLGGRPGGFFAPVVWAYVVALLTAVLVATTAATALALMLYRSPGHQGTQRPEPAAAVAARARFTSASSAFGRGPRVPLVVGGALLLVAVVALPLLGTSLIPQFKDRAVMVGLAAEPGTSNPRMTELATELGDRLEQVDGVESVSASIGRAVTGDRVTNVHRADVWVAIAPDADYDATYAAIEETVAETPDVEHDVRAYTTQKIRNVGALREGSNPVESDLDTSVLTGADKPLVVRVFGENQEILQREAERVRDIMAGVSGVVDPTVDLPERQPTLEIEVDLDRAQEFEVTPGSVRRAAAVLLQGIQVGSVFEEQKVFDVIVQGVPATRSDVAAVRNLLIDRPNGGHVRLGQVADVRLADSPASIARDAVSRRVDVVADVSGRSVDAVAAEVEQAVQEAGFPLEYHAEVRAASTGAEVGALRVLGFGVAALVAMYLLLQAAFHSWRVAALVLAMLPVALVGGLVVALFEGGGLSLGSVVGFVAVLALASRMSILLVTRAIALGTSTNGHSPATARARGMQAAVQERFAPVVITTVAVIVLMLPIAVAGSRAGLELLQPLAVTVVGGMLTTAFATLFLLPALYEHLPLPVRAEPMESGAPQPQERAEPAATETNGDGVPEQVGAGQGASHNEDAQ